MTVLIPAWTPLDGGPSSLPPPPGADGEVVALIAGDDAVAAGWVTEAALLIARHWSTSGGRVVVADAAFEHPLVDPPGGAGGEGLADALQWGSSVRRVAWRPAGEGFFLIGAGTVTADPAALLQGPRWPALCEGFRQAGVTLLALVPAREPSRAGVLAQADQAVVLTEPDEDVAALLVGWEGRVSAVLGRERAAPPVAETAELAPADAWAPEEPPIEEPAIEEPAIEEPAPELHVDEPTPELSADEPAASVDAWEADLSAEEPLAEPVEAEPAPPTVEAADPTAGESGDVEDDGVIELAAAASGQLAPALRELGPDQEDTVPFGDPLAFLDDLEASPAAPPREPDAPPVPTFEEIVEDAGEPPLEGPPPRTLRILLLVLLLIVIAGAAAAYMGLLDIPGVTAAGGTPAPEATPVVAAPPPTEAAPIQAFSLGLASFQDPAAAAALAGTFRERAPGVLVLTVAVMVDGGVVHRVLAGPAVDSAGALALAAELATASGSDAGSWVARRTPLAFQLGEMAERDAAERRVGVLAGLDVPAYVLAVRFSDGSTRFRVYAGAFASEAEAAHLAALLEERGLSSASLSDRTGRLPE